MKYKLLPILLIFSPTLQFPQPQWDFHTDSLHLIWKADDFIPPSPNFASVKLRSTDSSLIIQVAVKDSNPQFCIDTTSSDYIDIWLSEPGVYINDDIFRYDANRKTSFICGDTTYLYLFNRTVNLEGFQKEIADPEIKVWGISEDTSLKYSGTYEYYFDLNYVKEDIDTFLKEVRSADLKNVSAYFALLHLKVFPGTDHAIMCNKESYTILGKQSKIEIPDYSELININTELNDTGYNTTITIPAEGLGFIHLTNNAEIQFLVNIMKNGKFGDGCLFSTTRNPQIDRPESFNKVSLRIPVAAPLLKIFKGFGNYKSFDQRGIGLFWESLMPVFIYSKNGWKQVEFEQSEFYYWEGPGGSAYLLPNIQRFRFLPAKFEHSEETIGNNQLRRVRLSRGDFLIINDKEVYPEHNVLQTFLFSDNSIGLITTESSISGRFNEDIQIYLFLVNKSGKIKLSELFINEMADRDTFYMVFNKKLKISDREWDDGKVYAGTYPHSVNWDDILSWDKAGKSIILDLGNSERVKISWDEHGKNVLWKKL